MHFVHCGVHRQEFRRLVRGEDSPVENWAEPLTIGCPRCGAWYFLDLAPDEDPPDLEGAIGEAEERLQAECPDHAHRFEVDASALG